MPSRQKVPFTFQIVDGPNTGLNSGGFRVWVNGNDTYIASKEIGGKWKASLHDDEAWRLAQTSEDVNSDSPVLPAGHDRALWKFTPPEFVEGKRRSFAVGATRGSLLPLAPDRKALVVTIPDRWDTIGMVYVWMTLPGVDFDDRGLLADPMTLANGRRVWVTARIEPIDEIDPEPLPVSAMIEPLWPEEHGVPCPGMLLRGVHLDTAA
jgi:hypothetical protein